MNYCMGCLKEGIEGYCRRCISVLFNGIKIDPVLTFSRPEYNQIKLLQSDKLSISGIQTKHSLKLSNDKLKLTDTGGQYILKPVPNGPFENLDFVPINENLTMQIAGQVFNITVMQNGLIRFRDGQLAYITKRFDVLSSGKKRLQEDMAQVAGHTEETHGKNYKYDFSYEEIAGLTKKYVGSYLVEIEKFFKTILFNYLFNNGDAHLKNFSLYREEKYGDYLLTPAYDLLNTSLHVPGDSDTALDLFKDNFMTETYRSGSKYTRDDFTELGRRVGMNQKRIDKILTFFTSVTENVKDLVNRSLFSEGLKELYISKFEERLERVK